LNANSWAKLHAIAAREVSYVKVSSKRTRFLLANLLVSNSQECCY
jgi:hypothetical protein